MYSWSISWISWCLDRAGWGLQSLRFSLGCRSCFPTAGGSVKWAISVSGDFLSSQTDGAAAVLSGETGGQKEDREREREKTSLCAWGGVGVSGVEAPHCTTQRCIGERRRRRKGSRWIYFCSLLSLFYISIVFGQAPLYTCNYHWHCYFFQTQVQASPGWLVCFVSPGHS